MKPRIPPSFIKICVEEHQIFVPIPVDHDDPFEELDNDTLFSQIHSGREYLRTQFHSGNWRNKDMNSFNQTFAEEIKNLAYLIYSRSWAKSIPERVPPKLIKFRVGGSWISVPIPVDHVDPFENDNIHYLNAQIHSCREYLQSQFHSGNWQSKDMNNFEHMFEEEVKKLAFLIYSRSWGKNISEEDNIDILWKIEAIRDGWY